jgi:hypothetical protein
MSETVLKVEILSKVYRLGILAHSSWLIVHR